MAENLYIRSGEDFDAAEDTYWRWQGEPSQPAVESTIAFLEKTAGLSAGDRVLDLGCARGWHTIELARRGYRAVGLDLSEASLARALHRAKQHRVEADFVRGDMTRLQFDAEFDAVLFWGNTFGLFGDEDNIRTLQGLARALRPNGAALIETENRTTPAAGGGRNWHFGGEDDKLLFLTEDFADPAARRCGFNVIAVDLTDGRRQRMSFSWRRYGLTELRSILRQAGLHLEAVFGDDPAKVDWSSYESGAAYPFSTEAFTKAAARRILLCRKRARKEKGKSEEPA